METIKLVHLNWCSCERSKHVWEDSYGSYRSWDEIIGRVYLLKAHDIIEEKHHYSDALSDFEQAIFLFAKADTMNGYRSRALADKALVQCFLAQYTEALANIDQAIALMTSFDYDETMIDNRCSILVLVGAFSDALDLLQVRLERSPDDNYLRFTLATCLLHLKRYDDAVTAYGQVFTEERCLCDDRGLQAARLSQQPDWDNL